MNQLNKTLVINGYRTLDILEKKILKFRKRIE
jgi:hypothetical protein